MNNADLSSFLGTLPPSRWGIADVRGIHPQAEGFDWALSLIFPHDLGSITAYDEEVYTQTTAANKRNLAQAVEALKAYFDGHQIRYRIPEGADPVAGPFPVKPVAAKAGLGWVGKSTLLVTKEFGPRVRIATFLVDADLAAAGQTPQNACGSCRVCTEACPAGAIGPRFNPAACREKGHPPIEGKGRNFSCGICAFSCPWGKPGKALA